MAEAHPMPTPPGRATISSRAGVSDGAASASRNIDRYGAVGLALFCLVSSKWGSYLVPGPPYICDLIILGLVTNRVLLMAAHRRSAAAGARESLLVVSGSLLIGWTLLRLAGSEMSVDALRDAAPYLYCVVAFLVVPLDDRAERGLSRVITILLGFQLVWVTISSLMGGSIPIMPELSWAPNPNENRTPLKLFSTRDDFDVPVLGMFAALSLHRALSGRRSFLNLVLVFWALAIIATGFSTSGGFLAVVVQLGVVALLAPARGLAMESRGATAMEIRRQNRKLAVILMLLAVPVGAYMVKDTQIVRDAQLATGLATPERFENTRSSISTATARQSSWERTIDRLGRDPGTVAAGVGFGPNYLVDTGANRLLTTVGRAKVRSPHNFWLNVWARTGVIGLGIMIAVLLSGFWLALQAVRSRHVRDTDLLAILVVVSLPITATVGVIFESPFGIIPWFWALGHLSVRAVQTGMANPFSSVRGPARRDQTAVTRR